MKINDSHQKLHELYLNQVQAVQGQQQAQNLRDVQQQPQSSDKVDLSSSSRFMQLVNSAMSAPQPDRTARVEAIKQQVLEGSYKVDEGRLADKMMTDLLKDLG